MVAGSTGMAERAELEPQARLAAPARRSTADPGLEHAHAAGLREVVGPPMRGRTSGMRPRQVLAMQRLVGNRAVAEVIGADGMGADAASEELEAAMSGSAGADASRAHASTDAAGRTGPEGAAGIEAASEASAPQAGAEAAESAALGGVGLVGGALGGVGLVGAAEAAGGAVKAGGQAVSGVSESAATVVGGEEARAVEPSAGTAAAGPAGSESAAGGRGAAGAGGGGPVGLVGLVGTAEATGAAGAGGGLLGGIAAAAGALAAGAAPGKAGAEGADAAGATASASGTATLEKPGAAGAVEGEAAPAGKAATGETEASGGTRAEAGQEAVAAEGPVSPDTSRSPRAGGGAGVGVSEAGGGGEEAGPTEEGPAATGGGGGGLDLDGPAPSGEPLPDPTMPAAPGAGEVNRLGEATPEAETALEPTIEEGEAQSEEEPAGEIGGQAEAVESAGQDSGGGGIIDAIVSRAKAAFRGIASSVTGAARGVANAVTGAVRSTAQGARTLARGILDGILSAARSLKDGALAGMRSVVSGITSAARGVVGRLFGAVSTVMATVRAAVTAAIGRAMRGEPLIPNMLAPVIGFLNRLFGDIPGRVTALIAQLTGAANGLVDRLIGGVAALGQRVASGVASLAARLQAGVTAAAAAITSLASRAAALVSELPGVLRSAISWIVDRLLAAVRGAVRAIERIVNAFIGRLSARIQGWIAAQATRIIGLINRVRDGVMAAVAFVANLVRAALSRLAVFRSWLIAGATALLGRVLRRVLGPLQRALMRYVVGLIGPEIHRAIATAQAEFPNGLPQLQQLQGQVAAAQSQAASQASSQATDEFLNGIVNPEGDHFSVGISVGGDLGGGGLGVAGSVTPLQLDVVMDYRRNDIGFFVSPGVSGQVNIGDLGATGHESANFAWGTVASFGDRNKDVLQAYGGMFSNANYGYAIGGAYEAGVGLTSGGTMYRGGSYDFGPSVNLPIAFGSTHAEPGEHTPTLREGRPDAHDTIRLGEVLFPRGSADLAASSNGQQAIADAAATVNGYPAAHEGANVVQISISGAASRVWSHPRPGETREADNATLAQHRAEHVRDGLQPLVPGVSINAYGSGDAAAARAGKAENDASPEDQRATIFADTFRAGDAGGFGPDQVGPDRQVPDTFTMRPGLPTGFVDFSQRQAWGWDTTLSVAALEGAQAQGGVYGGLGISYSVPLGKSHFTPQTMTLIRVAFGLAKIVGDVMTLSPLGLARDILGVAPGVETLVHEHFGQAIGDWTIPMPPGVAVA